MSLEKEPKLTLRLRPPDPRRVEVTSSASKQKSEVRGEQNPDEQLFAQVNVDGTSPCPEQTWTLPDPSQLAPWELQAEE
jgi:hypothetical protein